MAWPAVSPNWPRRASACSHWRRHHARPPTIRDGRRAWSSRRRAKPCFVRAHAWATWSAVTGTLGDAAAGLRRFLASGRLALCPSWSTGSTARLPRVGRAGASRHRHRLHRHLGWTRRRPGPYLHGIPAAWVSTSRLRCCHARRRCSPISPKPTRWISRSAAATITSSATSPLPSRPRGRKLSSTFGAPRLRRHAPPAASWKDSGVRVQPLDERGGVHRAIAHRLEPFRRMSMKYVLDPADRRRLLASPAGWIACGFGSGLAPKAAGEVPLSSLAAILPWTVPARSCRYPPGSPSSRAALPASAYGLAMPAASSAWPIIASPGLGRIRRPVDRLACLRLFAPQVRRCGGGFHHPVPRSST